MSMEKVKRFMADHKKELIATTVVIGGAVLVILGCKRRSKRHAVKTSSPLKGKDIPIPDGLKVWNTTYLWTEGGYLNAIVDSIPLDDLGELGKQYIKEGLANPGDIASVIIGVEYEK